MDQIHLVYCHHLYMNVIIIFSLLPEWTEFGKYSTAIDSIDICLFPPHFWLCISIPVVLLMFLYNIFLTLNYFSMTFMTIIISGLLTFHWTNNPTKYRFSIVGIQMFLWNKSITSSLRTKHFFTIFSFYSICLVLNHITHICSYI